ncbi:MAG: hypothetical protein K6L76_06430 [Agarilytica sp.]
MNFKSSLVLVGFLSASIFVNASPENDYAVSIAELDGDVNSVWGVDVASEELTIGSTNPFFPNNHKAILTFDTSHIPVDQEIRYAEVNLYYSNLPDGMGHAELWEYLDGNIKVEVAGPFGFGGSHVITALDYYSFPLTTLSTDAVHFNFYLLPVLDLKGHINHYGMTQVAISLINNPENISVNFSSGEVSGFPVSHNGEPYLVVDYK